MVIWAFVNSIGGEIFVPKIPSYKIQDLAEAISPKAKKEIVGIRPGEKIHEEMITSTDSIYTIELEKYYAILTCDGLLKKKYEEANIRFKDLPAGFCYCSGTNLSF